MILLSVIIPTRNRYQYLENTLSSLTDQLFSRDAYEVIVIDNGSTDDTKAVCEAYKGRFTHFGYYYDETPGLHVGRHLGMKAAKSDILVYADDDIEAFPTWLKAIHDAFQDRDVMLVGGKNLPKFEIDPPVWILKMWQKNKDDHRCLGALSIVDFGDDVKEINPCYVYGCNFAIRRSVLLEAGGFHPDAMPQELIKYRGDGESHVSRFIMRKGYKTIYHPKASVYHVVPANRMTESYFLQRAYNQGISDSFTETRISHSNVLFPKRLLLLVMKHKILALLSKLSKRYAGDYNLYSAYKKGFQYHQREVRRDVKLNQWVRKDRYYDGI